MVSFTVVLLTQVDGDGSRKDWSRRRVDFLQIVLEFYVLLHDHISYSVTKKIECGAETQGVLHRKPLRCDFWGQHLHEHRRQSTRNLFHLEQHKTCWLCPAQEETAVPVLSLRLSFAAGLSSGQPRRSWAAGRLLQRAVPGVGGTVGVRALERFGPGFPGVSSSRPGCSIADLQGFAAVLLLFCSFLPMAEFLFTQLLSVGTLLVAGMCSAPFALWLSSLKKQHLKCGKKS